MTRRSNIIVQDNRSPPFWKYCQDYQRQKHKKFPIMDALDGFTKVRLTDKSSLCTTLPGAGIAKCALPPHGGSSASKEFHLRMRKALEGFQEVYCIANNINVVG